MIPRSLALMACLAATAPRLSTAQELPRLVFALAAEDEVQDLLFFVEGRPMLVRLRIRVDGQGFRARWFDFAMRLHREGDLDGNGALDEREAVEVLQRFRALQAPAQATFRLPSIATPAYPPGIGGVADLARQVQALVGPFAVDTQAGSEPARDDSSFTRVDLDRDGALSPGEIAEAPTALAGLDLDDDEVISAEELGPYRNPFTSQFGQTQRFQAPAARNLSVADVSAANTAGRILDRCRAGPRDTDLGPDRLRVNRAAFDRLDADRNGRVDLSEMEQALRSGADVELIVRLGRREPDEPAVEAVHHPGPAPFGSPLVRSLGEEAVVLQLGGDAIEVRALPGGGPLDGFDANYRAQFRATDRNGNNVLDAPELAGNPAMASLAKQIDGDGDGRLTLAELGSFLDRRAEVANLRASVAVAEQGRSLLNLLDTDRDGKIGIRELREVRRILAREDRDGDGRIDRGELVRHHRWSIGRGRSAVNFVVGGNLGTGPVSTPTALASTRPPVSRPAWFLKMDRNGDGDLSPREFLGSRSAFESFDADGDGLIGPAEAVQTPRKSKESVTRP